MTDVRRIDPGLSVPAYLGNKTAEYGGLDTFKDPGVAIVRMTSDEVTSMCPITGAPDFEVIDILYAPRNLCVESKALKLYFQSLRNTAAFVESLALEVAEEIARFAMPQWVRVDVTQKARGGVSIVAVAVLHRDGEGNYVKGRPMMEVTPPRNFYLEH